MLPLELRKRCKLSSIIKHKLHKWKMGEMVYSLALIFKSQLVVPCKPLLDYQVLSPSITVETNCMFHVNLHFIWNPSSQQQQIAPCPNNLHILAISEATVFTGLIQVKEDNLFIFSTLCHVSIWLFNLWPFTCCKHFNSVCPSEKRCFLSAN